MSGSTGAHGRNIFVAGDYIRHFTPDDRRNPFRRIYQRKRKDAINIIRRLGMQNPRQRILDVGGGMGRLSLQLAQSESGMVVLADISAGMLALAEKNNRADRKVRCVNADAHRLPFRDHSFDVIAGLDLVCHLEKPEAALAEFYRILAEGGTLLLDSTNSNPLWTLFYPRYLGMNPLNWLRTIRFGGVLPGWEKIVRHYPRKKFIRFLHDAGFRIRKIENYGPLVCPKWHLAVAEKARG